MQKRKLRRQALFRCPVQTCSFGAPRRAAGRSIPVSAKSWLRFLFLLAVGALHTTTLLLAEQPDNPTAAKSQVILNHPELDESSGLAFSHRRSARIWTHNDSGDGPRLFSFDLEGKHRGTWLLAGVQAVDWEDMASFRHNDTAYLLVGDIGDNDWRRHELRLHLFTEPDPDRSGAIDDFQTIRLRLPMGARDCEGLAVDAASGQVFLASKRFVPVCEIMVFSLAPWLSDSASSTAPAWVQPRHVATVPVPLVTAMDIDPSSRQIVLCSYFQAFVYRKPTPESTWVAALKQSPTVIQLPRLRQIEAIAFDSTKRLWITSEGVPAPLVRLAQPEPQSR